MEYYFDTSSLVALARYYHPFDKDGRLFEFVHSKFQSREIPTLCDFIGARCITLVDFLSTTSFHVEM